MPINARFANFADYLRFRVFSLRVWWRQRQKGIREYLSTSPVVARIGVYLLPKMRECSFLFIGAILEHAGTPENIAMVAEHLHKCHQMISTNKGIRYAMSRAGQIGDQALIVKIFEGAVERDIKIGPPEYRYACLARGDFMAYIKSYRSTTKKRWVLKYFPEKFVTNDDLEKTLFSGGKIGIISTLGPGDEAAFSTVYTAMVNDPRVDVSQIKILCDQRFYPVFKRSFPDIEFVPSRRSRYINNKNPWHLYSKLPVYDLHVLMCNESMSAMNDCDRFLYMHDLIYIYADYLLNNEAVCRYQADADKAENFKSRLPDNTRLIGLVWRSSLSSAARDFNYFSIEQISPIFDIEGITFVNLQYNGYEQELKWVESRWPGKIVDLGDVDKFDDFDSVVAVIQSLEAVITPPTLICHLAAQSGCQTLLLANTLDVTMRCRENGTDVWNPKMLQISGDSLVDKPSLVKNLVAYLEKEIS